MLSNRKFLNLWKIVGVIGILVFGLIVYFGITKYNSWRNNNNNNSVNSGNMNDNSNDEGNIDNGTDDENNVENNGNQPEDDSKEENNDNNKDDNDDNNKVDNENDDKVDDEDDNKVEDDDDKVDNNTTPGNNLINGNKKIVLVDRMQGNNCAQAIEYFYEDNEYRYYFTCIKSNSMYVIVNGVEYKLVDALKRGVVTMKELENNGYKFLKESKNLQIK